MGTTFYISYEMAKRMGTWAYEDWLKGKRYLPSFGDESYSEPEKEQITPRPTITYNIRPNDMAEVRDLRERVIKLEGQLHKYFEDKKPSKRKVGVEI